MLVGGSMSMEPMIEHYVLFKSLSGREADLDAALAEFEEGMAGSPWLLELTYGPNINLRSKELGWTHGMLSRLPDYSTFQNEYWNHEAHARFLEQLDDICETRFALDYEAPGDGRNIP